MFGVVVFLLCCFWFVVGCRFFLFCCVCARGAVVCFCSLVVFFCWGLFGLLCCRLRFFVRVFALVALPRLELVTAILGSVFAVSE